MIISSWLWYQCDAAAIASYVELMMLVHLDLSPDCISFVFSCPSSKLPCTNNLNLWPVLCAVIVHYH